MIIVASVLRTVQDDGNEAANTVTFLTCRMRVCNTGYGIFVFKGVLRAKYDILETQQRVCRKLPRH